MKKKKNKAVYYQVYITPKGQKPIRLEVIEVRSRRIDGRR